MQAGTVIAFHGQQGSGKTTLSNFVLGKLLQQKGPQVITYGIKSTFTKYVNLVVNELGVNTNENLLAYKTLQRSVSTWGEQFVDKNIWSNKYYEGLTTEFQHCVVLSDDIRTPMNLNILIKLAEKDNRKVYFFRLEAPEETRRSRCAFREGNDYTEQLLSKPVLLHSNFHWNNIDTTGPKEQAQQQVEKILEI